MHSQCQTHGLASRHLNERIQANGVHTHPEVPSGIESNNWPAGLNPGLPSDDQNPSCRVRRNRPRGAASPDPHLGMARGAEGGRGAASEAQRGWPPALIVDGEPVEAPRGFPPMRGFGPTGGYAPGGFSFPEETGNGLSHLPDGINMEEAR